MQGGLCPDLLHLGRTVSAPCPPVQEAPAQASYYCCCWLDALSSMQPIDSRWAGLQYQPPCHPATLSDILLYTLASYQLAEMQEANNRSVKMPLMFSHHELEFSLSTSHIPLLKALKVSLQAVQFCMGFIGYRYEDCICRSISTPSSVSQHVSRASCETHRCQEKAEANAR